MAVHRGGKIMSAIVGMIHYQQDHPVAAGQRVRMMSALRNNPADDERTWEEGRVFLGYRGRWTTPESMHEQQPICDRLAGLAITADVILDNRDELFDALAVPVGVRQNIGDAQLILLSYRKWQERMPARLLGDFAFVIWDERRQRIFAARDFSGSRTLYYYHDCGTFAFCTAVSPLLTLPQVNRCWNDTWLAEFLAIPDMFDSVDTHSTVYRMIHQIPPAHYLSARDGKVFLNRYDCRFDDIEPLVLNSDGEYEEAFRDVFQKAVSARIRTCRGVGSYLSGGLDSCTVAGFAAKMLAQSGRKMHTYSYVPEEGFVDWTPWRMLPDESSQFQSMFTEYGNIQGHILDFKGKSPLTEMDDWLDIMEMPYKFFENSFWLKGVYEEAQKNNVGVLLSGERGNFTISWGPAIDYYALLLKKFHWIRLSHEIKAYAGHVQSGRNHVFSHVMRSVWPWLSSISSRERRRPIPQLISRRLAKKTQVFDRLRSFGYDPSGRSAEHALEFRKDHFEKNYWWQTVGQAHTKASLRFGMMNRDPTNDWRVIRFCLSVPVDQMVQNGMDRALVRRSTEGIVPDRIRLNQVVNGVQAADMIHRMQPMWDQLIAELQRFSKDSLTAELFNRQTLHAGIEKVRSGAKPELVQDWDFCLLIRAFIVFRFLTRTNKAAHHTSLSV
ncbi:asparagine synthetase B [Sporolactobacillus sp. THM7-4]|nr:asparagine synthetase B [Sporolactobacillus sp. THM7-4]